MNKFVNIFRWFKAWAFFSSLSRLLNRGSALPEVPALLYGEPGIIAGGGGFSPDLRWTMRILFSGDGLFLTLRTLALMGARVLVSLSIPVLLHVFLLRYGTGQSFLLFGGLLSVCVFLREFIIAHYFSCSSRLGLWFSNSITRALMQKALAKRMSSQEEQSRTVNILQNDCRELLDMPLNLIEFSHDLIVVLGVMYLLYLNLGAAAIGPICLVGFLSPLTVLLARRFTALETEVLMRRDRRLFLTRSVLYKTALVRAMGWTDTIAGKLKTARMQETDCEKRLLDAHARSAFLYGLARTLVATSGFILFVLLGNKLSPEVVFPALSLFIMLEAPFGDATIYFSSFANALASLRRLTDIFDVKDGCQPVSSPTQGTVFQMRSVDFHAEGNPHRRILTNVDLSINEGEAVAIVGPVGSGKTTLLRLLLGELKPTSGTVISSIGSGESKVGFVSQHPFVFDGTLEENIRCGSSASVEESTLSSSALLPDIASFVSGLDTPCGPSGSLLSGGQRQRIAFARVVHAHPGIVLCDDPFSSIDAVSEECLVTQGLFGALRDTTRIVVTGRLAWLSRFNRIIFISGGRIHAAGPFPEIVANNPEFREFVETARVSKSASSWQPLTLNTTDASPLAEEELPSVSVDLETALTKLLQKWRPLLYLPLLMAMLLSLQEIWLSLWTASQASGTGGSLALGWFHVPMYRISDSYSLAIYLILSVVPLALTMRMSFNWSCFGLEQATGLHSRLVTALANADMGNLTANQGDMLGRLSFDLQTIKEELPEALQGLLRQISFMGIRLAVGIATLPLMALALPFIFISGRRLAKNFVLLSTRTRKAETEAMGPVITTVTDSLAGAEVIRAGSLESFFMRRFDKTLALATQATLAHRDVAWWFSARGGIFFGSFFLLVCVAVRLMPLDAAVLGLFLTWLSGSSSDWFMLVNALADTQSGLISNARLEEMERLPAEPDGNMPFPGKSRSGLCVEAANLTLRYGTDQPPVLNNISFTIAPGEKVALVGRSGTGKTTLLRAVMRFLEPAEGRLLLDGIEVRSFSLAELRSTILFLPQECDFLPGTLRENLDPLGEFGDGKLYFALEQVGMRREIAGWPQQLDENMDERAHQLSAGQRQLLCLARAFLSNARLLLVDEVTAHLDDGSSRRIMQILKEKLPETTILIAAHRKVTTHYVDRVLDLSKMKVKL